MARQGPRGPHPTLYPAQTEGVRRIVATHYGRYILAYGTGCGKTATALSSLKARGISAADDVLVVCPAMVRRHWAAEAKRWIGQDLHPIEYGRTRKLAARNEVRRDLAYGAKWRVVSYDLLREVDVGPYAAIVFDEIHHIAHWSSRQATLARTVADQNPEAMVLGLSATLIPTEVAQLWHPLRVVFGPNEWGEVPRSGPVNWDFASAFCKLDKSEYGTRVYGAKEAAMPRLKQKLAPLAHRITREDIHADSPPLSVRMCEVPGSSVSSPGELSAASTQAVLWHHDLPPDITHAVILTYHRHIAHAIAARLATNKVHDVRVIDGSLGPARRGIILEECAAAPSCLLVATSESIREGVRLMWAQKVLMAQWRQSPVQVVQVLGRFQSVGDSRRPDIEILTDDSLYSAAMTLLERTRAINAVLSAGKTEAVIQRIFKPKEMTEARMGDLTRQMLASHGERDEAWSEESDDEW